MSKYAVIFPLPGKQSSARKEIYRKSGDIVELGMAEDLDSFSIDVDGRIAKNAMSTRSIAGDSYSSFDTNHTTAESIAASINESSCRVVVLDARLDLEMLEHSVKEEAQVPRCFFRTNRPLPLSKNTTLREKRIIQNAIQFDLRIHIGNKECVLMKTFADLSRLRSELEHEFACLRGFEQLGFERTTGKFNIPDLPLIQSPDCNGTFRTMLRKYLTTYGKTIEGWLQSLINSLPSTESPGLISFLLTGRL